MNTEQKKQILKEIPEDAYNLYEKFYHSNLKGNDNIIIDNSSEFSEEVLAVAWTIRLIGVLIGRLHEDTIWNELVGYKKDIQKLYDALNY